MKYIILLITLYYATFVFASQESDKDRCWSDGNGEAAKWWPNGTEIVRGRYYYICIKSRLTPVGCINDNGTRIAKDSAYINDGFEFRCVMDTEGYLFFEPASCVDSKGKRHQPGDTWDHETGGNYWFICQREYFYNRPYLSVKTQGCLVGVNRLRIQINDTHDDNGSWYSCQDRYDSTALCLMGCVVNGTRKKAGEQWDEGEYTYTCIKRGDHAAVECVGCTSGARRLRSGDRYMKDDTVVQCTILFNPLSQEITQAHNIVGCVERNRQGEVIGELVVGCRWYEIEADIKYEHTCTAEGKPEPVGCTLRKNGFDYLFIPTNSYTIHHPSGKDGEANLAVACRKEPNGQLTAFNFDPEEIGRGRTRGLKYSTPRGRK